MSKIVSTITHHNKCSDVPGPIIEQPIPKLYLSITHGRACLEHLNWGNHQNILKTLQTKKLKPINCQHYMEKKLLKVALIEIASMMQGKDISSILDSKWIVTEQNYATHRIHSTITFSRMKQSKIKIQLEFHQEIAKKCIMASLLISEFCCVTSMEDRPAGSLLPTRPAQVSLVWPVHFKDSVACCCGSHGCQGQWYTCQTAGPSGTRRASDPVRVRALHG